MSEKLKKVAENQGKLYRLEMVNTILYQMHHYVNDIFDRFKDEFCDCEDLEDSIIEDITKHVKEDITTLNKYL